ncbi:YqzE family protein [Bacillus sp. Marseille-P3661]|uniref:YqzE family protein n=1 Tax=Bacillus sp. Marseille-P3661 TaxID=1936234 RepID=UPI000C83FAB6|nr:YqzE family protein [Bacillus sp. Marseille-P3661]
MSSNDYIKYMTEQFVKYANSSKEERINQKRIKKSEQGPFLSRMFGIIPLAIMLIVNQRKKK